MKHTNKKKGFTLVELVIVIAVIAILAGVMIATFSNVVDKANKSADLQEVKSSLDAEYYDFIAEGQLPTALEVDDKGEFVGFANDIVIPASIDVDKEVTYSDKVDGSENYKTQTITEYSLTNGTYTVKKTVYTATDTTSGLPETNDKSAWTAATSTTSTASYNTVATITGRKGTVFTVTLDVDETSNNFGYYTLEEVE